MKNEVRRVVIIGGGHNGLIAAFYLAKAGFSPLVLERRHTVGGGVVTDEIYPGFHCPSLAHAVGPLLPPIESDMELRKHGLQPLKSEIASLALHPDGWTLPFFDDPGRTAEQLKSVSSRDAANYAQFNESLQAIGKLLAPLVATTPPDIDRLKADDYIHFAKLGVRFRALDRKNKYRLLRWAAMAVADLSAEWFETPLLRAAIEARGIFGCFAGPRSPGTSLGLLLQEAFGARPFFVAGGAGALTQALAKSALAAGAQIRTNADVVRVRVQSDGVKSVVLAGGEEITASTIVSNADPHHTFLELVEPSELDPSFLAKIRAYRATGVVAKVNLALSGLPSFSGVRDRAHLSGRIHIGPDTDYLERAYDDAKYGNFSTRPNLDIAIPSLGDASLAPPGAHVMSVHIQYAPYRLKASDWAARREPLADAVVKTLSDYAPNLLQLILHRQVLTPVDIESTYGMSGGHIFHGEHALDQMFAARPVLGWARYRTPISGLYLCGAGTHPGGGTTGASAWNACREIIKDLKSRR